MIKKKIKKRIKKIKIRHYDCTKKIHPSVPTLCELEYGWYYASISDVKVDSNNNKKYWTLVFELETKYGLISLSQRFAFHTGDGNDIQSIALRANALDPLNNVVDINTLKGGHLLRVEYGLHYNGFTGLKNINIVRSENNSFSEHDYNNACSDVGSNDLILNDESEDYKDE